MQGRPLPPRRGGGEEVKAGFACFLFPSSGKFVSLFGAFFARSFGMIQGNLSWIGWAMVVVFALAYLLVFGEEKLKLKKSKPVMLAAGLLWILASLAYAATDQPAAVTDKVRHVLTEYAELFLFLLSAMSFVNAMIERNVFEALRGRLVAARLSPRGLFWITGGGAFVLSPVADNLTTALVMGTVVLSTLGNAKKALTPALVNIVVAANAGGAFSPFGDITTLMVWQKGVVAFSQFFQLFIPALINWLVPAALLSFAMPSAGDEATARRVRVRHGGWVVVGLFLATVAGTVFLDHGLHLPPFLGMMTGLGALNLYGAFLYRVERRALAETVTDPMASLAAPAETRRPFNIFEILGKVEWDTLLFFYGIMLCVGALGAVGLLAALSDFLYRDLGATTANVLIGLLSAVIDNIPLTFAVLTMNPPMDLGQWLLVTLTAGVGGSLLALGSAAGVALMGIGKGAYTFVGHLKWSWALLLGYAASVAAHLILNRALFV
jgi:Na+/H+ antiporter NhaD/arsenite permease-like protein